MGTFLSKFGLATSGATREVRTRRPVSTCRRTRSYVRRENNATALGIGESQQGNGRGRRRTRTDGRTPFLGRPSVVPAFVSPLARARARSPLPSGDRFSRRRRLFSPVGGACPDDDDGRRSQSVSQSVLPSIHSPARSSSSSSRRLTNQPPDRFSSVIILKRKCGGRTDGRTTDGGADELFTFSPLDSDSSEWLIRRRRRRRRRRRQKRESKTCLSLNAIPVRLLIATADFFHPPRSPASMIHADVISVIRG